LGGVVKEAAGKLKEKVGDARADARMRESRNRRKVGGKVQRKVGDIKKVFSK
jgi:uncharacterized protein YjbJ (UPF0337 family)